MGLKEVTKVAAGLTLEEQIATGNGVDLIPAISEKDADHNTPTRKEQLNIVERTIIPHSEYRIEDVQLDFKIPDEALFEGLESKRVNPISPAPPREGRATFTVKKNNGEITTFDNIYLTNINFSDMESIQLHSTFSGPFLHTFDRVPRSLTMSVALPNTKLLDTITEIQGSSQLAGESKEGIASQYFDIIGDWRNGLRRFYENTMRASKAESVSVRIQGTIYGGHIISLKDIVSAESDAVAIGLMEMIVFDVLYPIDDAEEIITTIALKQEQPRENKVEGFIRKRLEKLKRTAGILFLNRDSKNTNDREEAIVEGVKEELA